MTRPDTPDHPALEPLIVGAQSQWIPPFIMALVGDADFFAAATPVTSCDPEEWAPQPIHFWNMLPALQTGYLTPGDGNYARTIRMRRTKPAVMSQVLNWHLAILRHVALMIGRLDLRDELTAAARVVSDHFAAYGGMVIDDELAKRMISHFAYVTISPKQRDVFWQTMDFPPMRDVIGPMTEAEIVEQCEHHLPGAYIRQFTG